MFPIANIADRWANGKTFEQYLDVMQKNREMIDLMMQRAELSAEDWKYFGGMREHLRALVVSEDWCPDCSLNIPILMKVAEAHPSLEVRFVGRDDNYDVLEFAKKGERKAIPTFFFFDEHWNEVGHWVERPMLVESLLSEWERGRTPPDETDRTAPVWREFRQARTDYYRDVLFLTQGLWRETIIELRAILGREAFSNLSLKAGAQAGR